MNGSKKSKERPWSLEEQQEFIEKINDKIRRLREDTGISQETFAHESGIDRTQWSKMERGVDMKLSSLYKALAALGVTPAEFFRDFK
jgi:transcriptional regulator with XRE-family HTH domain